MYTSTGVMKVHGQSLLNRKRLLTILFTDINYDYYKGTSCWLD